MGVSIRNKHHAGTVSFSFINTFDLVRERSAVVVVVVVVIMAVDLCGFSGSVSYNGER